MIFEKLKGITIAFHSVLMMLTFAVSYSYFADQLGREIQVTIPEIFYPIVMVGVVGVSVVTALFHIIGGGIMGATAGGVLMGMKMGMFLGVAYGLGRLWLYAGASFVAGCFYWPDLKWSIIGLGLATITCLVIQKVTYFIWNRVEGQ